jgi:integrator complex subunit 11
VKNLSFSAHADAKGIMQLIRQSGAKNVMLVHGEKVKMQILKQRIMRELGIACYDPPNGMTIHIAITQHIPVDISKRLLDDFQEKLEKSSFPGPDSISSLPIRKIPFDFHQRYSSERWDLEKETRMKPSDIGLPIQGVLLYEQGKVRTFLF